MDWCHSNPSKISLCSFLLLLTLLLLCKFDVPFIIKKLSPSNHWTVKSWNLLSIRAAVPRQLYQSAAALLYFLLRLLRFAAVSPFDFCVLTAVGPGLRMSTRTCLEFNGPYEYAPSKDVLLIGVGVTVAGLGLESGSEHVGVDPLQAGNAVQLVMVLGLTVGWILSYVFRVSNKEMTYAQQLRDYEYKVMAKRLEGLTEAELTALMELEEEKRQFANGKKLL